ncbi:MAG: DUF5063 domain-containing protein [Agriterribacter sp.]
MDSLKSFLGEPSTAKMIESIKNFIFLMEAHDPTDETYARRLHIALVALYEAGLHFKEIQLSDSTVFIDDLPIHFIDKNSGPASHFLGELIMREALFKTTFGKCAENNTGTINQVNLVHFSHSLYDMYKLLKTQVFKIEYPPLNTMAEDGLWQIKNGFYNGWGTACAKAIELLHSFRY